MITRPSNVDLYSNFKALLESPQNNELECRNYLKYVDNLLAKTFPVTIMYNSTEYRGHNGNTDYIISANIRDESGFDCVQAYIWELKAPQCYIFQKDTENRLAPSKELISAENQLINYHYELQGDDQFKRKAKVLHRNEVRMGGIIIGSNSTLVKGYSDEDKIAELYQEAFGIRKHYFYEHNGIRLITWDTILRQFSLETHSNEIYTGKSNDPVSASI